MASPSQSAHSTPPTSTSPPSSPEVEIQSSTALDDIFSTSPIDTTPSLEESLSDLPALKRQHVTSGYREGLAIAKGRCIQDGFDAGYPIGLRLGGRVGILKGIVEGLIAARGGEIGRLSKSVREMREGMDVAGYLEGVNDEDIGRENEEEMVFHKERMERLEEWEKVVNLLVEEKKKGG